MRFIRRYHYAKNNTDERLRNTNEIMDMCKESNDPVFVTKNGYGELVIMSMEAYEITNTL